MTAKQWVIVSSQSFLASAVTTLCKPSHYVYIVTHSMCVLSHVWLFVTSWTVAHQAPLSMEFSKPEYWSELPLLSPRDLPDPEIELMSPVSPALQADSLPTEPQTPHVVYPFQKVNWHYSCPDFLFINILILFKCLTTWPKCWPICIISCRIFGYNGSNQSKKTNVLCDRLPTRKTFSPYSSVELVRCSRQSPDEVNVTWRTIQKSGVGFFIYFLTSHKE